MRPVLSAFFVLAGVASVYALGGITAGCGDNGPVTYPSDGSALDVVHIGNVGDSCDDRNPCRPGLACNANVCAPGHLLDEGVPCIISGECKEGFYCGPNRRCLKRGSRNENESCGSESDCATDLRCNPVSLSAECQPEGKGDQGAACTRASDCFGGLLCAKQLCTAPPVTSGSPAVAINEWAGADCKDDTGGVKAYFRVPRGTADDGDFFRLPFPNDARKKSGRVDFTGFPTPGADLLGYDVVDRWLRYAELTADGFSVYPTIVMRFSASPDFDTLKPSGVIRFVDITTPAGADVGFGWSATNGRSNYVCNNAMVARPRSGLPLVPGHTYAFFLTNGAKAPGGAAIAVSSDLTSLLGKTDPGGALSSAYAAYAPLRAWADAQTPGFDLSTIVNATVFTVGHTTSIIEKIPTIVGAASIAPPTSFVNCGTAGAKSPCPQADGDRACGTPDPDFDEWHALVSLPNFQKGKPPYQQPSDGGDVEIDANGPKSQGNVSVCMAVTVPKGTSTDANGWPIAIYAHETGGSFRSFVKDGIAKRFAKAGVATISFDGVGHGTRRGTSNANPAQLWYDTANPPAMRGGGVQAAADVMSMVKVAGGALVPSVTFDPTRLVLVGHGQGATGVALGGPYTAATGAVVAGMGTSFLDALVGRHNPVDFTDVTPVVLGIPQLATTDAPLTVFQNVVDSVDPMSFAPLMAFAPPTGVKPKHTFMVYGQSDTYTTSAMQFPYFVNGSLAVVRQPSSVSSPDDLGNNNDPGMSGNLGTAPDVTTAGVRQYVAGTGDGHFVYTVSPDAIADVDRFVGDIAAGNVPHIGK